VRAAGAGQQARRGGGRAHLEATGCSGSVLESTGEHRQAPAAGPRLRGRRGPDSGEVRRDAAIEDGGGTKES
jgi:hypothetical protein